MTLFPNRPTAALVLIVLTYCACFCSVSVQSWIPFVATSGAVRTIGHSCHYSKRKNVIVSLRCSELENGIISGEERREAKTIASTTHNAQTAKAATRREILAAASSLAVTATGTSILGLPSSAIAAEPVNAKDTDSVLAIARRKLRPKPPKVLRRKLSQDFAVLLMRSSYNALDEMDCVAMDQFQRDFFLIRVSEYETYCNNLGAGLVKQGDLTDAYYFDFISFIQYKTINREVTKDPQFIFEEQQMIPEDSEEPSFKSNGAARFRPVIIKRDPKLTNKLLIPTHQAMVGATILDKLDATFNATEVSIPKVGYKPDSITLLSGLRQIVTLFLINGYAFKGEIASIAGSGGGVLAIYQVTLNAPATLWGGKVLQQEGDPIDNDFLLKTLNEFIKRSGYETTKSVIKYDGADEDITITVR